jgi:hypothetical protein
LAFAGPLIAIVGSAMYWYRHHHDMGATAATASNGSNVTSALGQLAQVGASTISRAPHGGSHGTPPSFNGFHQ